MLEERLCVQLRSNLIGNSITDGHILGTGIIGVLDECLDSSINGSIPEESIAVGSFYVLDKTETGGSGIDQIGGSACKGMHGE